MSDEMTTKSNSSPDLYKERSTNKKTPDYVTRASQPREGVGVDMSTCTPPTPDVHPTEPEPVGPLAEQFLNQLAAQQDDEDLTARRRAVLARLGRAHTTSPIYTRRQEQS
ncbi:hypothetical protein ABZU92_18415 [Micromonospora arida]|uniref:hypothetical protein n=1 Tax=Micromonospora arida TaxID=2203715 RepID=UPI0033A4E940